ncbi:MAG: ABC transporter permease [Oscillospiraceae bacterium]|jgi:peptide/nickel transport system permease protein|nr:ABC transporter permease [Oscillospiraceae bacterium]
MTPTSNEERLSLDDERRVKVLSPSALVFRRFIRNKLAIFGTVIIVLMFLFAFFGGLVTPYDESRVFYIQTDVMKEFAYATKQGDYRPFTYDGKELPPSEVGRILAALSKDTTAFSADGTDYTVNRLSESSYEIFAEKTVATIRVIGGNTEMQWKSDANLTDEQKEKLSLLPTTGSGFVSIDGKMYSLKTGAKSSSIVVGGPLAIFTKLQYNVVKDGFEPDYNLRLQFEQARGAKAVTTIGDGFVVTPDGDGGYFVSKDGEEYFFASDMTLKAAIPGAVFSDEFRDKVSFAIDTKSSEFTVGEDNYSIADFNGQFTISLSQSSSIVNVYGSPSKEHPLGTDMNGMDILTRLMFGGRVSLMIGFVAIIIENLIGIILGGISGFFGGFLDMLIMRAVDVFNCIPMIPLYIIIGTTMDAYKIDPHLRIYVLMLIIGVFGWPSTARLVRGQILSLREQEFMVAAEACGIRPSKRIFRHLVPNVIPQLIVLATMGLGGIILAESTLSFLGLGVRYPMASWGSTISAVNNLHVMTEYLFAWIPAGFCILITVLGFNFVGDGLRDAFDPKMKR